MDLTLNSDVIAAALAVLTPLGVFAAIMVLLRQRPYLSAGLSIGAVAVAWLSAVFLLVRHWHLTRPLQYTGRWLITGSLEIPVGVLLDPLSLLMLVIVTSISLLVQVYSLGYMAGDPGFARYYAFMSLFAWAMISLSISPNLLQLYVFWELVGLSSYLLIGFWYEKFSATEAGKKAFVMTRLGDVAFFLGLLLVLINLGNLNIMELNRPQLPPDLSMGLITLATLLIFGGIIGKSAQFPLLTWLPDAMEGPTPVSALLHSATMVAAGVFLLARLFPFFSLSATTMTVCLAIGTISMLLAATMAMVARDIKQVWAYSTISQLGFMIMGLAAGGYVAGVFHLTTHAAFKALLFLCAGAFIHAFGTNDMFEIGRKGGRGLKIPMVCIVIAAAALAGLPPLAGFFSKEAVLGTLTTLDNPLWLMAGLLGAFLTAYYTFRLIFVIALPRAQTEGTATAPDHTAGNHSDHHGHGSQWLMAAPLLVLAALTLVLGWFASPLDHFLAPSASHAAHPTWLLYAATGLAAAGLLLALLEFGLPRSKQEGFVERLPVLSALFAERWYLDRLYRLLLDHVVYRGFSALCTRNDNQVIDGGIDALSKGTLASSRFLALLHAGGIQHRLMVLFAVMVLMALYFF